MSSSSPSLNSQHGGNLPDHVIEQLLNDDPDDCQDAYSASEAKTVVTKGEIEGENRDKEDHSHTNNDTSDACDIAPASSTTRGVDGGRSIGGTTSKKEKKQRLSFTSDKKQQARMPFCGSGHNEKARRLFPASTRTTATVSKGETTIASPSSSTDDGSCAGMDGGGPPLPPPPPSSLEGHGRPVESSSSFPGAFDISILTEDNNSDVHRLLPYIDVQGQDSDDNATNVIANAELVDESALALAATQPFQEEIDRLRRELQGFRDLQQQQVVLAEPVLPVQIPTHALVGGGGGGSSSVVSSMRSSVGGPSNSLLVRNSSITLDGTTALEAALGGTTTTTNNNNKVRRLRISSLDLHGRDDEIDILHQLCFGDNAAERKKQFITISGPSGCGKSALVASLKASIQPEQPQQQRCLMAWGKFEQSRVDQPYFGIVAACREICNAIQGLKESTQQRHHRHSSRIRNKQQQQSLEEISDRLDSQLSPQELLVLTKLVPQIGQLVTTFDEAASADQLAPTYTTLDQARDGKARLHFVFRKFIRVVSNFFAPMVMVLDDLQSADSASLELLEVMLEDRETSNLRLICMYRSEEVLGGEHPVKKALQHIVEKKDDIGIEITNIEIGNLSLDQTVDVVMDALAIDDDDDDKGNSLPSERVRELCSLCHKRTLGNAFFLVSFLDMLEMEGHLVFDDAQQSYTWDIDKIKTNTAASSNMVDLLNGKMRNLPEDLAKLLPLAACLGFSFEQSKLEILWRFSTTTATATATSTTESSDLQESLSMAVKEGFIECLDDKQQQYRWTHEKVQESSFSLIPQEEDLSNYMRKMGTILSKELSPDEVHKNIFLIVSLLNQAPKGHPLDQEEKLILAELNLNASKQAIACSAFASAAKYATVGIENLPADKWNSNNYQLSFDLYACAVEANEVFGQYDAMKSYCDEVLENGNCPLLDKLKVKRVIASQMANAGKYAEAVEVVLEDLSSLGCAFPKSKTRRLLQTLRGLWKLKRGSRKRTKDELANLPIMKDANSIETVKLLDQLCTYSYMFGSDITAPALFRIINITLEHGISELSSPAFVAGALFLAVIGDFSAGHTLANYAMGMEARLVSGVSCSRTKFLAGAVYAWLLPWDGPLKLLFEAYTDGMASGDTVNATFAMVSYLWLSSMRGKSLMQILDDCSVYCQQMKDLKRDQSVVFALLIWQSTINLTGATSDPIQLQGDVLTDLDKFVDDNKENTPLMAMIHTFQLRLCAVYGRYGEGAKLFREHGYDWPKAAPGHALFMDAIFSGGIVCFANARLTGNRKDRKYAMKARSTIKGWVRQKNPNVGHYEALLDAECAALQKKPKEAERCYQSAISIATRDGILHDSALSNERCADFMLSVQDTNSGNAIFYVKEAIRLYSEWGSTKKARQLQEKYSSLLGRV